MMKSAMNKTDASKIDTEFDAELDESTDCYGVFGAESGFCYELYSDERTAMARAEKMTVARRARKAA